jgi:hypothetical protein
MSDEIAARGLADVAGAAIEAASTVTLADVPILSHG